MPQRTIAVIDGNSLMHRAFHALPLAMTAPDGRPTNAAFGFVSMLLKLVQELAPHGVVVAFDKGRPAFRIEALAQYKIQRPPTDEALKAQFPMVRTVLEALSVPVVELDGWEGDDILGTLAARGAEQGFEVLLVTGDRDAFQLVTESVRVVTTKKGISDIVIMGPAQVEERYGINPAQVPDYLGLKGDTSDNIPGVPGIGEKTAAKLLQQYGTMEAALDAADRGEIPGKQGENLRAGRGSALASRVVATISKDVPVDIDLSAVTWGDYDPVRVAQAFTELRFMSLLERLGGSGGNAKRTRPRDEASPSVHADASAAAHSIAVQYESVAPPLQGEEALAAVNGWIESGAERLGVAFGEGTATLFDQRHGLAVAGPDGVAVVSADDVEAVLVRLLEGTGVAAENVKTVLQEVCPPDSATVCPASALEVDSARLFDVGVAAYLLESGRSSYDVDALAPLYLGGLLCEATHDVPREAVVARAVADLAPILAQRLADDGSSAVMDDIEMPLVPVLARMERAGVGLDVSVLERLSADAAGIIDTLRSEIHDLAGGEFLIDSPKQLAEVLFERLGLPTQKKTKTGYSTDASVLAVLAPLHPIAEKIVAYRELTKLKSTYLDALPRLRGQDGRLHTSFNQTVAATGRLSSSNPNLQNIPVRTDLGRRIREAFVPARPGDVMVSADYSQIELRILAHLSADQGLIDAFSSGADFHAATAARVFGVALDSVEPGMRARAKAVNFGIVYGQTAHGLGDSLGIGYGEAQAMIDRYYAAYPGVRAYLDETVAQAHRTGYAVTLFGRKRRIPELASGNHNLRQFGERTAMNHPMQGTAADIMKLAMIEVDRRIREEGFSARMVLQVHDELVFECPPSELERLSAMAAQAMSGVAELSVQLEVSIASGPNWASAK